MDLAQLGRQALEKIRSQRGKSLQDNTLYYDNAYISVYKEKGGTTKPVEESTPSSPVAEPKPEKISFLGKSEKSAERSAPPAEPDQVSVRYVFEDEDGQAEPVEPPAADEPLEAAVRFEVQPGLEVWLVPDEAAAAKLGLKPGSWLLPAELALLEGLTPEERIWVLQYMTRLGGRLVATPSPKNNRR
jgi:hypothetical protein